jgi:hypothetical protein
MDGVEGSADDYSCGAGDTPPKGLLNNFALQPI